MDYNETRNMIREEVHRRLEDIQGWKVCPECKVYTTMAKVCVEPLDEEGLGVSDTVIKWRCLNCLKLFTETLRERQQTK